MKKGLAVLLSALVFGLVAGGVMVGVNYVAKDIYGGSVSESQSGLTPNSGLTAPTDAADNSKNKQEDESTASQSAKAVLDVSDIVEEAMPQVVSITNVMLVQQRGYSSIFDYFYGGGSSTYETEVPASGSGIIVKKTDDELLIATNNHVVEDSSSLSVTFIDGETVDANIKGTDAALDVAVIAVPLSSIKAETLDKIGIAKLHTADDLKVGQGVIAIGNALGYGQSVTVGYISALDRDITTEEGTNSGLIQVDAAINPGNSGGALINMDGELIGINVAKASGNAVEGMGYSIPISNVTDVLENLSNAHTRVKISDDEKGSLGIYTRTVSGDASKLYGMPEGAMIFGFSDEEMEGYEDTELSPSAAKDAGLLKNDIITKFDGQSVDSADELVSMMQYYKAGTKVSVVYARLENGEWTEHTAEVTLNQKAKSTESEAESESSPDLEVPNSGSGEDGQSPDLEVPDNGFSGETPNESEGSQDGSYGDLYEYFKDFMDNYNKK